MKPDPKQSGLPWTNQDLFDNNGWHDQLFIVTEPPEQCAAGYVININLAHEAAALDGSIEHCQPFTVADIRNSRPNTSNLWLLSGGVLIQDQAGRIAVGLRDGNGADPFTYANIGAGRCDRRFSDHCRWELAEEFILCLREDDCWYQVQLLPDIQPQLLKEIRTTIRPIARWQQEVECAGIRQLAETKIKILDSPPRQHLTRLWINWRDKNGRLRCRESFSDLPLMM